MTLPLDAKELDRVRRLGRDAEEFGQWGIGVSVSPQVLARVCAIVLAQDARIKELEAGIAVFGERGVYERR